eukprot:921168-Amphidinium_carterae.1
MWACRGAVRCFGQQSLQNETSDHHLTKRIRKWEAIVLGMRFTVWFVAVLFAAGPGSLYAAVKAVPGFMELSRVGQWILSQSVVLCTALLTSFALPQLAKSLQTASSSSDVTDLVVVGKLFAAIVLPCLVT